MGRRTKSSLDTNAPQQSALASRLELIRKRHRELILKPRQSIVADFNDEFGDPFDDALESERMETADVGEAERY